MKYLIIPSIIALLFGCRNKNQSCVGVYNDSLRVKVYEQPDKMPVYKNGSGNFLTDFAENLIPTDTILTVLNLKFIVLSNGRVSNFKIYDSDKTSLITDKINVKSQMKMHAWTPGECRGEKVAVKMNYLLRLDWQE